MLICFRSFFDPQKFLTVDDYNMDECLEHLVFYQVSGVYYQVPGEPGVAGCNAVAVRSSCKSDIYLGKCGCVRTLIH